MDRLTKNDRGTFIVTTQGSTHLWEIADHGVFVTRNPDFKDSGNPYGLDGINGRRNAVTKVDHWPEVDDVFLYYMHGDIPWTRSSRIRSIERVSGPDSV